MHDAAAGKSTQHDHVAPVQSHSHASSGPSVAPASQQSRCAETEHGAAAPSHAPHGNTSAEVAHAGALFVPSAKEAYAAGAGSHACSHVVEPAPAPDPDDAVAPPPPAVVLASDEHALKPATDSIARPIPSVDTTSAVRFIRSWYAGAPINTRSIGSRSRCPPRKGWGTLRGARMDFAFTAEQRSIHERMRALGAEAEAAAPDARLAVLAKGGALGLSLPREHGGGGLDHLTTAHAYEGLGATLSDGGVLLAAGAHLFGVASMIAKVGTPEQQRAFLPALASGERVATVAATELNAGSDVAEVESVAERAGEGFRVTGHKRFVTWADRAELFFTVARDGRDGRGLVALLVPKSDRVRAGALLPTAGLRGARLAPVDFDGAECGPEALLGRAGAGLAVFQIAMTFERALVLAFRLGAMQRQLEEVIRFAKTRVVGKTAIAKHQAISHRVARMRLRLETARLLTYRAAWELDRGGRGQLEAALAKWHLAESAVASALDDLRLRGGAGYLEDGGLPGALDDALGGTIHSGTEDVLATIVARWIGL